MEHLERLRAGEPFEPFTIFFEGLVALVIPWTKSKRKGYYNVRDERAKFVKIDKGQ
ncbi:MAG: hypothetical protein FWD89_00340 [Firmicutes bacterium]|nr:hypothetical protein [Bacillota bacterium]